MPAVLGVVPMVGRERLSGLLLAGEPLFVHAARTLASLPCMHTLLIAEDGWRDAASASLALARLPDVEVVGSSGVENYARALGGDDVVVVHDPLCPLTPLAWVRSLVDRAGSGEILVAVLPVVDTLKTTREGVVTGTVDRTGLHVVSSPTVFPARLLIEEPELTGFLGAPAALVNRLRAQHDVDLVPAPGVTRRADDSSAVEVLAAVEALADGVREV